MRMLDLNPCVTPRALQSRRQRRRALQLHGTSGSRNGVQCQFSLHVVQRMFAEAVLGGFVRQNPWSHRPVTV